MVSSQRSTGLNRFDLWAGLLTGAAAFALYARTLAPGLLPSDSAEFQVLATFQATAHTTGYSVYLILARLLGLLPLGDAAYRVNLFSALMGGMTAGLVYLLGVLAARSRAGGWIGALALSIAATFWSQAVIAEVYTSASAFLALVLVLTLCWLRSRKARYLFAAGLAGGLSLGVHGSVALAAPGVAVLLLWARANLRRDLPAAAGGAALGLALMAGAFALQDANRANYNIFRTAYLPAASAWDETAETLDSPLERFLFIITAEQWRPAMFADPARVMPGNAGEYFKGLVRDYSWPVLALMLIGLGALLRGEPKAGTLLGLGYLCQLIYLFNYQIGDLYVFFIPAGVYAAAFAAAGVGALASGLRRIAAPRAAVPAQISLGVVLAVAAAWPFAPARLEALRAGEAWFDFAGMPRAAEAAAWRGEIAATVRALEPGSIVYLGWGELYAFYYVAYADLGRTDLHFIEPTPYSQKGGMAISMLDFIRANKQDHPQYFAWQIDRLAQVGLYLREQNVGGRQLFRLRVD